MAISNEGARRALAVGSVLVFAAAGAAGCSHEDPIVGCWAWSGGIIQAFPDGTLQHADDRGEWTDEGGNSYVFTWASGNVDGIVLEDGTIVEMHLEQPPGANAAPWTATPTSCSNVGSSGTSSGSEPTCGASGEACSSSVDCCGVCNMDSSSSFYLTCE